MRRRSSGSARRSSVGDGAGADQRTRVAYRDEELESVQVQGVSEEYLEFATFDAERGRMISADRDQPQASGRADRLGQSPNGCSGPPIRSTSRFASPACSFRVRRRQREEGRGVRQLARRVRGHSARQLTRSCSARASRWQLMVKPRDPDARATWPRTRRGSRCASSARLKPGGARQLRHRWRRIRCSASSSRPPPASPSCSSASSGCRCSSAASSS